jgi:type VI secretion system secreted protein Hcp
MLFCSNGDHVTDATLYVRKAGKTPLEYIVIEMKKVMITSVSTGGSGGEDKLTENISLNFAHVKYEYQPQKDDGSKDGGAIPYLWDIEANTSK